jgi:glucose-6-phosphate dehydrogenase assembly protein OpcA
VREYRDALDRINHVRIEYVAPESSPEAIAPKALILAGWLMTRLGWRVARRQPANTHERVVYLDGGGREIVLEFESVSRRAEMHGWIARVELLSEEPAATAFIVARSEDGRYLETQTTSNDERRASRLLIGGDKTEAELLARELEIRSHDRIYEEAVRAAAGLLEALSA